MDGSREEYLPECIWRLGRRVGAVTGDAAGGCGRGFERT